MRADGASLDVGATIRRLLLALVGIGAAGLETELLLLEHFESVLQWTPLALLGVVVAAVVLVWRRPSSATVRFFQIVMAFCVAAGVVGIALHYRGNVEFELEHQPLHGWKLFWKAVRGATPALAPGAMTQLGLLGLVYCFRHPALRRDSPAPSPGATIEPLEKT